MRALTILILACLTGGLSVVSVAAGATAEKYSFLSDRSTGSMDRVEASLEVSGNVNILDENTELQSLKLSVLANLKYDERSLRVTISPKGTLRSVRHYDQAQAAIKIDGNESLPTLRDDRRLIAVEADEKKSTLYSPAGPLTHDELDLIDLQANTLVLDRFLPPQRVAVDDSWKHTDELVGLLLGLDAVSASKVESRLVSVKNSIALVETEGTVEGGLNGVSTEIQLRAKYQFDFRAKRITWFGMLIQEKRSVGHVGPGLDVVARLQMKIDAVDESPELADAALNGLNLEPVDENTWLAYESTIGGWRLVNDRRWFVTRDESKSATLRMLNRGELIAQCNISTMQKTEPEKLISLERFQADIEEGLGDSFGQFLAAKQSINDLGYRVQRIEVEGTAGEVPIQWIYYTIADESGRQLVMVFIVEGELIEQMAGADEQLAASIQFADQSTAAVPTLAPR